MLSEPFLLLPTWMIELTTFFLSNRMYLFSPFTPDQQFIYWKTGTKTFTHLLCAFHTIYCERGFSLGVDRL